MRIALTLLIALCAVTTVAADDQLINPDRPGIADGSTTVDKGTFQIETGVERDDSSPERDLSTPTLLRYGLGKALELRVEGNGYQHVVNDGSGWAPVSIGFKSHFLEEDQATHRPSLGVIGRIFVPSGSGDSRSHHTTGDLRLAADLDLNDRWSLNPNAGVDFEDHFTAAIAALTVQYNITKRLNVFVDGGYQSKPSSLLLDTGTAWIVNPRTQLDFSIGWGAHGTDSPNVFWSAGISRSF
jgi:hypothetical protein